MHLILHNGHVLEINVCRFNFFCKIKQKIDFTIARGNNLQQETCFPKKYLVNHNVKTAIWQQNQKTTKICSQGQVSTSTIPIWQLRNISAGSRAQQELGRPNIKSPTEGTRQAGEPDARCTTETNKSSAAQRAFLSMTRLQHSPKKNRGNRGRRKPRYWEERNGERRWRMELGRWRQPAGSVIPRALVGHGDSRQRD